MTTIENIGFGIAYGLIVLSAGVGGYSIGRMIGDALLSGF